MPTLTPSYLPPPATTAFPSPPCTFSNGTCPSGATRPLHTPTSPEQEVVAHRLDVPLARKRTLKIPFVKLETPAIQEDMAASLAVALLGHVLFLKSQVPLCAATLIDPVWFTEQLAFFPTAFSPIAQLARIPGASSASRAAKKRSDMINAFDELSSHLHTTFSALSTALARNPTHRSTDTVYLALVLGPTIGAAKARVVLALEGLEVKVWGMREDIEEALLASEGSRERHSDEDYSSDDGSEAADDSTHGGTEEDTDSDVGDAEESPPASEPPSPRSPSPSLEEPSRPSSPAPASSIKRPLRPSLSPNSSQSSSASRPHLAPKPERTHAEGQQALRAAERLLARTLVNAYAEGGGMAAELGACAVNVAHTNFTNLPTRSPNPNAHTASCAEALLASDMAPATERLQVDGQHVARFPR
jgi:hypothetical protein